MNMSVTQFVQAPAIVGRSRSVWQEIIDTVIEGPPRTAADEIAEYLSRHQYDLSPTLRIELERRHQSQGGQGARPHRAFVAARDRRRGDRMM